MKHPSRRFIITSLVTAFFMSIFSQIASASTLGNVLNNSWSKSMHFFATFYHRYPVSLDFLLFFMLFMAAYLIGLRTAFGGNDAISRQLTVFAVTASAITSIALVFGMHFTILKLKYVALAMLFFMGVILLYTLLLKLGLENHKILAFVLALLIAFLLFLFGAALMGDGVGDFGNGGLFSGNSRSNSRDSSGGFFDGWFGGGKKPTPEDYTIGECRMSETNAFEENTLVFKPGVQKKVEDFALKCQVTASVVGYANELKSDNDQADVLRNQQLGTDRAQQVGAIVVARQSGISLKSISGEVKNNGFLITCDCRQTKDEAEDKDALASCRAASDVSLKSIFAQITSGAKSIYDLSSEPEVVNLKKLMDKCEAEYNAKVAEGSIETGNYRKYYSDAIIKYYAEMGEIYFDQGSYSESVKWFQDGLDKLPAESNVAHDELFDKYYALLNALYSNWVDKIVAMKGDAVEAERRGEALAEILADIKNAEAQEAQKKLYAPNTPDLIGSK